MGKECSEILHSIKNTEDLTLKQMFDISEKLIVGQSDEIYGVNPPHWEDSSWKLLSLVGDEKVISLSHTKVRVFSDSVFCLGKKSNISCEERLEWFRNTPECTDSFQQVSKKAFVVFFIQYFMVAVE